jgi:enoyl-CoA hydratase/carnithine racemase
MRYACGMHADEVLLGGRNYRGEEAVVRGLAHRVVADELIEVAVAEASELGSIPADAYRQTKTQLHAPTMARIHETRGVNDEVRRMWGTDETLRRIAAYVERLRRR